MDETSLDEGPAVNFERATLEIAKELETHGHNRLPSIGVTDASTNNNDLSDAIPKMVPPTKNALTVPFKHIDAREFFTDRNEIVERAFDDCSKVLVTNEDGNVIGTWLLTEIGLWDTEKERLVLLAKHALYSIKYDFISLKVLEYCKVLLREIDTIVSGELIYPPASLIPRLNGLAEGVSSLIHNAVRQQWSCLATSSNLGQFEPRKRNMNGVRVMWNRGAPLSLDKKWNPFAKNIPWLTYASHPLFWHKGTEAEKARFDVEAFHAELITLQSEQCNIISSSIILENYLGLGAVVHNRNALGFFKIRGKMFDGREILYSDFAEYLDEYRVSEIIPGLYVTELISIAKAGYYLRKSMQMQ